MFIPPNLASTTMHNITCTGSYSWKPGVRISDMSYTNIIDEVWVPHSERVGSSLVSLVPLHNSMAFMSYTMLWESIPHILYAGPVC